MTEAISLFRFELFLPEIHERLILNVYLEWRRFAFDHA